MNCRLPIILIASCLVTIANAVAQPVSIQKDTTKHITIAGEKHYLFTVKPGNTLFSIAKAYGVSVDEINSANPDIKINGLKSGYVINIPAQKNTSLLKPKADGVENIAPSAAADSTFLIELAKKCKNTKHKTEYTIALFLPIYTNEKNFDGKYTVGGEFYEGVLMGIEDFKSASVKLQVQVFDTENDTVKIKEILKETDLKKFDLIIGPLFASAFQMVAKKAKADSIVCVSPFSQIVKVIDNLPNVHKITPSAITIIDQSAQYIASNYGRQNVILITSGNKKDAGSTALYQTCLKNAFAKYNYTFKEFTFQEGEKIPRELLSTTTENFFVIPCSDQAMVGSIVEQLYNIAYLYSIKVWGLNQWQNYDNLAIDKLTKLNLHFARTGFADTENKLVSELNLRCRSKYKADASEYFLQGYDIINYYIAMLDKYGMGFGRCVLCDTKYKGVQTDIKLGLNNTNNGLENIAIQIMQYKNNAIVVTKN